MIRSLTVVSKMARKSDAVVLFLPEAHSYHRIMTPKAHVSKKNP